MPIERRAVLQGLAATTFLTTLAGCAGAETRPNQVAQGGPAPRPGRKMLIKGGYVVTNEPSLGELKSGDVLIDGSTIAAIAPHIDAQDVDVIDASTKIVLPGLIDTHRHTWETLTRSMIPEGDLEVYKVVLHQGLGPHHRPQDVYIGNLLGAIGAMNSGITTMLDWSHVMNTPEHADAAIQGLVDCGLRALFAHGYSIMPHADGNAVSDDIRRIQKRWFNSSDQLVTLYMATRAPARNGSIEESLYDINLARDIGVRITMHTTAPGLVTNLKKAGKLGPDMTHVHTEEISEDELQLIADSGGSISSSSATEMMSGHGWPSAQRWLRHGLRPSFSVDNESRLPADLFAQMRGMIMADHELESEKAKKSGGRPILIPVRDVLEFATLEGARATGLDSKVGTLRPGKKADIILMDLDDISLIPNYDPVATVVLRAQPANVSWVIVDGKVRKRDGKLVDIDLARVRRLVAESHSYITQFMAPAYQRG